MPESIADMLKNWVPFRLAEENNDQLCKWLYLGEEKINDPFFDDTIFRCLKLPYNSMRKRPMSSISILPEWATEIETAAPAAFIFHVSRCGSTLAAQLLGLQESNIVLSEVPLFDALLRKGYTSGSMETTLPVLKAAIDLYSAKRAPAEQYTFIKTDSWHIHFYKELRRLYPAVPFILLYRRPDEVIRSQQKKRGMHAAPGVIEPGLFGFNPATVFQPSLDEYMAKVLETYFTRFIEIAKADNNTVLINYNEGPMQLLQKIVQAAGVSVSDAERAAMEERAGFHGKYPGEQFNEAAITDEPPAYQQKAFQLYKEVEELRKSYLG